MKIIFDSDNEKSEFIKCYCPSIIGLEELSDACHNYGIAPCYECWENAVQIEIKNEETIEMTKEQTITYADCVYEVIKDECKGMDAIYEDTITDLVGNCGLAALKRAGLVEGCGSINFRPLYVLSEKVKNSEDHIKIDIDKEDARGKAYRNISDRIHAIRNRTVDECDDVYNDIEFAHRTGKISAAQYISLKRLFSSALSKEI